jgi:hypothetical protein
MAVLKEEWKTQILEEKTVSKWNGRSHQVSMYRWIKGVPIRDEAKKSLLVNYFSLEIKNKETGKTTFYNSWITNKPVDEYNVSMLAEYGRTRWKIENEHNNVLKNRGYNLEHNGEPKVRMVMAKTMPGKSFSCSICCLLCFTRYWICVMPADRKPAHQSTAETPFCLPPGRPP